MKNLLNRIMILVIFLLFFLTSSHDAQEKPKVIIDVDMGQLNDDAVTMFMLLQSGEVDMLGITVVSGNTWVEEGTAYTLRQLELINRVDVPVYIGAGMPLMGDRQPYLDAEERLWGNSTYLGAWRGERPPSYLELETEPYRGYPSVNRKQKCSDFGKIYASNFGNSPHKAF